MKEIDGLSFHPDGTLWGWSTGDGLVTIDTTNGQATLVVASPSIEVEDLTWNTAGTMLYGVGNLIDGSPDIGLQLLSYDGTTITHVCEELTQSLGLEIEALDTLPDDTLIFGLHDRNNLPLGVIDVANCQIIAEQEIPTGYDDVEGIAWPEKDCDEETTIDEELGKAMVSEASYLFHNIRTNVSSYYADLGIWPATLEDVEGIEAYTEGTYVMETSYTPHPQIVMTIDKFESGVNQIGWKMINNTWSCKASENGGLITISSQYLPFSYQ